MPPALGRLDHVALAVPDLLRARAAWSVLGASIGEALDLPEHGVRVAFVTLPNTHVELMEPLGENSPIAGFMTRNPGGGMHHVCFAVPDLLAARDAAVAGGARPLGEPRVGAQGKPVLFLHPKDFSGTLIELMEEV